MDRRWFLASGLTAIVSGQAFGQTQQAGISFPLNVAIGAEARALKNETYDPAYVRLVYPMGDVGDDRGVCTDTVIRAFRHAGVDLQVEVHEDMRAHFSAYPKAWGLTRPDRNIDHRRVPNIETLFRRRGGSRRVSELAADYGAGDVVSWRLSGSGLPHIGVVTRSRSMGEPLIAHNIGAGTKVERVLFAWPIEGWFRFEAWT
ncbi:MAG: DUF1287 domain-containing protein [Alphaproteobacteria bacterium]|nr:DUF1287 domain-containing protein [Alphaproteobacteria bacterium]